MARIGQQAGQRIAENRTPRMTHVQRPRGVRAYVFHVDLLALPHVRAPISRTFAQHGRDDILPDNRRQAQVQKARTCHLGTVNPPVRLKVARQRLGNVAGFQPGGLGKHHRRIGRHIAMRRISRRLHRDIVIRQPFGQRAFAHESFETVQNKRTDIGKDVHVGFL